MNYFAIELDESTNVANCIICKTTGKLYTTDAAIFILINLTILKNVHKLVFLPACTCTDDAKLMTGTYSGLVPRIKTINENTEWTRCYIHRQSLVCKRIVVLQIIFHSVNLGNFHVSLILHPEVKWLSHGKALAACLN